MPDEKDLPQEAEPADSPAEPEPEDQAVEPAEVAAREVSPEGVADLLGTSDVLSQNDLDAILARTGGKTPIDEGPPPAGREEPFEVQLPKLESSGVASAKSLELLKDINLHVKIELGRTRMYIEDILKLSPGSVVELDKLAGDPVDILVNDRLVAKGEVLILNDNFCVRIGEIVTPEERLKAESH